MPHSTVFFYRFCKIFDKSISENIKWTALKCLIGEIDTPYLCNVNRR